MQNNYLKVGETVHCLRCHVEYPRANILDHWDTCPQKDKAAALLPDTCGYCKALNTPQNAWMFTI